MSDFFSGKRVVVTGRVGFLGRCRDTSRAERAFGFRASRDFWKGLQETLDWYRERVLEQRSDEQDHVGTSQY